MRRLFVATTIGLLWTAIFAFSLFARSGPERSQASPAFTIPPFEPPAGAVITVTTDLDNLTGNGDCTLREAIQAANTDAPVDACPAGNGDDLILLPTGVYILSLAGRSEDANATGDLDILSSLVISGAGSAETIIDANQIDRVLHILTGTVEIRGVTVQNGRAADGAGSGCGDYGYYGCPGESGGGIVNLSSTRLVDVVVQNSRSGDGGDNVEYTGHGGGGGGIVNEGMLEVFAGQIIGNRAGDGKSFSTSGGDGGGVYNLGVLIGDDLIVSTNQTGLGGFVPKGYAPSGVGGGISNQGMLTITNGRILSNLTPSSGGGVYKESPAF